MRTPSKLTKDNKLLILNSQRITDEEPMVGNFEYIENSLPYKPHLVKRNGSPYLFYFKHNRDKVKKDYPELSPQQVVSKLGDLWNDLSDEEKKPYEIMAQIDKERYNEEMKEEGAYKHRFRRRTSKALNKGKTKKRKNLIILKSSY